MKPLKDKICRECKFTFEPRNSLQVCCNPACAITYAKKKAAAKAQKTEKAVKKVHAKQKREFYDNDLKTRKAAAKAACHAYIRARDSGKPCICCGRPLGAKYDAGHFLESGNHPKIRYHEDNIHAQSVHCNQYRGGDSDDYKGRLIEKIGVERVEYLLANKGGTVKRTASDYKEIEQHYKQKLKELENER